MADRPWPRTIVPGILIGILVGLAAAYATAGREVIPAPYDCNPYIPRLCERLEPLVVIHPNYGIGAIAVVLTALGVRLAFASPRLSGLGAAIGSGAGLALALVAGKHELVFRTRTCGIEPSCVQLPPEWVVEPRWTAGVIAFVVVALGVPIAGVAIGLVRRMRAPLG